MPHKGPVQRGRSRGVKLDGPAIKKWMARKKKKLNGPKEGNWTVIRDKSRRFRKIEGLG